MKPSITRPSPVSSRPGRSDALAVCQSGGWAVWVRLGSGERLLATRRSRQPRLFRRLDTLAVYLRAIGICRFDVDATGGMPENVEASSQQNQVEESSRVYEPSAYDTWLREEISRAVVEADDPATEWISHEQVKQDMKQQKTVLLARLGDKAV